MVDSPERLGEGKIVIPGVGAFGSGMRNLEPFLPKLRQVTSSGIPILGICLGLHVMLESSEEAPGLRGMGVIKGRVAKIRALPLPHMGWSRVRVLKDTCPLFRNLGDGYAYFVHSYHALPEEDVTVATVVYGEEVTAAVWKGNLFGVQFHPEKSGSYGLKILKNFVNLEW